MAKEERKKEIVGLKRMRKNSTGLAHCENCDCKRYSPCGCQKGEKK